VLWEAPQKEQQVALIKSIGPQVNLGNIPVQDVLALETMRRGLRSDTFELNHHYSDYVI
jgi:phosphosulfolactate synthase